jgi:alginate O-acetyltransferase complex protein AlgJ
MADTSEPPSRAPLRAGRWLLLTAMLLALGVPLPLTILTQTPWGVGIRAWVTPPLDGYTRVPGRPPLRLSTWRSGQFQRDAESWFGSALASRGWLVRLTNQFYYSLFRRSYMIEGHIVVGRDQYLYGLTYLHFYCRSDAPLSIEALARFAAGMSELRSVLARRNNHLLFIVTPSKATGLPEFLPARLCDPPAAPDHRRRLFVRMLRESGVAVIDGPELARAMKARDPLPPFPRGSVHWSLLAGSRVAGVVMEEIRRISGDDLGQLTVDTPRWNAPPVGSDADYARLLNLLRPPLDYPTGAARPVCRSTLRGRRTVAVAVGGSFLEAVLGPIGACGLFERVDFYFYYTQGHDRWPGGGREPVDRAALKWGELLARDGVTMVELNEMLIGTDVPYPHEFLGDALAALR